MGLGRKQTHKTGEISCKLQVFSILLEKTKKHAAFDPGFPKVTTERGEEVLPLPAHGLS